MTKFESSAIEQFDLTAEQAKKAYDYYVKNNLVKFSGGGACWSVTHGALWDGDPLRKAASL